MTEQATAEIIAFPQRQVAVLPALTPVQAATAGLSRALTEQHEALTAWRDALVELRDSLHQLGRNLQALDPASRAGIGL